MTAQDSATTDLCTEDLRVATGQGGLHARLWHFGKGLDARPAPIVLLHDSLGCVELWRDFPERIARATRRPVIAYDRLGFGRSDANPATLTAGFVADEARTALPALCERLGLEGFVLLGHSVGGGMAIEAAAAFPGRCRALVTESAQTFAEDRTLDGIRAARQAFADPAQMDRLRRYHGDKADWVLHAWVDTWLSPAFADWRLDGALARVTAPVLAIHGDTDEYGSTRHPEQIGRLVQGPAEVEILQGCGHVPHRERPDAVVSLITAFLAGKD